MSKQRLPKTICGSPDKPLMLGGNKIPCYVLEDDTRVLVKSGMLTSLNMKPGGSSSGRGDRLAKFISTKSISPFISSELEDRTKNPIKFTSPSGLAYGYEATILADLCDAVLSARAAGQLNRQQEHIAKQCEILVRGFARVGIIALVDEATGFQDVRARKALEEILDKFIAEELRKWAKTFPDEFYRQMFKLRGWPYDPASVKRPSVVGHYTNDLIYDRLAPGIVAELKKKNPRTPKGHRKHKNFQWLTEDVGDPRLREHLSAVIALMKASANWKEFYRLMQRALPRYGDNMLLDLTFED